MKKAILVIMALAVAAIFLTACSDGKTVEEISVANGSVKTVYSVDEEFAKDSEIAVKYKNGTVENVKLNPSENVSGFDTSTSGTRTMTITYGGKSLLVEYNVTGHVNTQARVGTEVEISGDAVKITLNIAGLDTLSAPLYAIRITARYASDKLANATAEAIIEGWMHEEILSDGKLSALFYPGKEGSPLSVDCAFAEITFTKTAEFGDTEIYFSGGYAGYEEIDASDGEELLFMPSFDVELIVIED